MNPIIGFQVDPAEIQTIGRDLQRPECILAEPDGSLWSADARGGVVHIRPDGSQEIITQSERTDFADAADEATRFTEGTLPNGLAFARDGDILISNFGTDRLEVMKRTGETRVLHDTIDGAPIGKVNFVLRDSKDRIWLTVSTQISNWMDAVSPNIRDGFIALADENGLRIVADGFAFTNEIRPRCEGRVSLHRGDDRPPDHPHARRRRRHAQRARDPMAPPTTTPLSTALPSTPSAICGAPM